MSLSIDQKIVEMTFNGQSFISNIKSAIAALSALKEGLNNMKGSADAVNELDSAGKKFSLSGMASGIEQVGSKFSALSVLGISALASIASKAVSAGIDLVKSFTIDPIKDGLDVYETKINAIQTILANTQSEGTNLNQVTQALNQLNTYANQTVYNFGQMAQNIGTFTAAGVDLKTSVASIKGIANLAALSGSSAEQASTAMYQLSQAIASGSVKLQDWNSVVNAGLGGKVFQNALIQTAKATGVNIDAIIKKAGSFRNSLQQGWLSSKILTQTLDTFTGDLSAKQLIALGYTQKQTAAILKQAAAAKNSATQIRTITQLQQALSEEVGTAWSAIWQTIVGNIVDATSTLTKVHNTLESLFTKPIYSLNNLLLAFDKLGGRTELISAIGTAFTILGSILKQVTSAFRQVFPPVTALTLMNLVLAFENLEIALTPSVKTLGEMRQVFVGIFSIVKIALDLFSDLVGSLFSIGSAAASSGPGILALAAKFSTFLVKLEKMVSSSQQIKNFFNILTADLRVAVQTIGQVIGAISKFGPAVSGIANALKPVIQKISAVFSKLGDAIALAITSGNFQVVVAAINGLLLTRVLVVIKNFFKNFGGEAASGGGLLNTLKESFESLTGALQNMQTALKAKTLDEIATAVGVLTLSMFALSTLNVNELGKSLTAITIMMVQLIAALAIVSKIAGSAGIVKMAAVGFALNELATAILILSGAVAILSQFSWEQLEKGLGAIAILLLELTTATKLMSTNTKGLVAAAYSMEVMAVALNILAQAVKVLGNLDFATLAKGIGSIAVLLVLMVAFQKFSGGEGLIASAAAMLIMGAALNVMAVAITSLGKLSLTTLAKGIGAIAATLLILVVAMNVMEGSIVGAAALVIAAAAILILANALNSLGGMSWGAIAKALVVLAGALVLLAAASIVMEASLPGAAALLVMAAALAVLTPVIIAFSQLSWEGIAKALVTLAGTFLVLGVASLALTPLVGILAALGVGVLLIGVGILAAGVGLTLFAGGLALLAVSLTAAGAAIAAFVTTILTLLPTAINEVANIIVALADGITKAAPAILVAITVLLIALLSAIAAVTPKAIAVFGTLLTGLLNSITRYAPKIINTFYSLILDILNAIAKYYPKFVEAAIDLVVNMINGIAREVPRIANAAVNLIVAFINAIEQSEVRVAAAGINMVINLINSIANLIRSDTPRLNAAGANLGSAIVEGMADGIFGGISGVIGAAEHVASAALNAAKSILHINSPSKDFIDAYESTGEGAVIGINNGVGDVVTASENMGTAAIGAMKKTLSGLGSVISDNVDLNPKITPVLDLSQAQQGFSQLASLSKNQVISATASANKATSISASNAAAAAEAGLANSGNTSLSFTQNNYSPKALDAATVYRQTKNQLSITKGALSAKSG